MANIFWHAPNYARTPIKKKLKQQQQQKQQERSQQHKEKITKHVSTTISKIYDTFCPFRLWSGPFVHLTQFWVNLCCLYMDLNVAAVNIRTSPDLPFVLCKYLLCSVNALVAATQFALNCEAAAPAAEYAL